MGLSNVQQHLLNFFNLVKVAPLRSTLEAFEEILNSTNIQRSPDEKELDTDIFSINTIIKTYDLEIVETVDEITSEKQFILINTGDNIVTQKSTFYDDNTTAMFSKVIKECITSEEGHISGTTCLNLSSQVGITKAAAELAVEKLVKDKWLVFRDGTISIGMRSIVELKQSIMQFYPDDVKHCPFCQLIIVQGYICNNCKVRCHYACSKKYSSHKKSNCVCPKCKEIWDDLPLFESVENNASAWQDREDFLSPRHIPTKRRKRQ